jgi:hypothetical protein
MHLTRDLKLEALHVLIQQLSTPARASKGYWCIQAAALDLSRNKALESVTSPSR